MGLAEAYDLLREHFGHDAVLAMMETASMLSSVTLRDGHGHDVTATYWGGNKWQIMIEKTKAAA